VVPAVLTTVIVAFAGAFQGPREAADDQPVSSSIKP
jgi:hypothetical protein